MPIQPKTSEILPNIATGGEYDPGMLQWGAENIEQSMRTSAMGINFWFVAQKL